MSGDFKPSATISALRFRADILRQVRNFFDQLNFFEVETPLLSRDVVVDRFIEPIDVQAKAIGVPEAGSTAWWLQTSPEFGMKRLLAAGADAIYQITRAFRANESGQLHNPEFTILEWYRSGDDMAAAIKLLGDFAVAMLKSDSFECISYQDAFLKHTGLDAMSTNVAIFQEYARRTTIDVAGLDGNADVDQWRNLLLSHAVEPYLGLERPVILFDYPASQAALAKVRHETPPVAERFELYFRGMELANGYHELLDAAELLRRNQTNNDRRTEEGRQRLPEDSRLIEAMHAGLPACSGVALGIDRLVMAAGGFGAVQEVMAFPISIA